MTFGIKKLLSIHSSVSKVWKMRFVIQTAYKINTFTKELVTNAPCILSYIISNIKKLHEHYGFCIPGQKLLNTLVNFSDLS